MHLEFPWTKKTFLDCKLNFKIHSTHRSLKINQNFLK